MAAIEILAAVQPDQSDRYQENLTHTGRYSVQTVASTQQVLETLESAKHHIDVLVIDNNLDDVFTAVKEIRHTYPRLLIVLVDEEADFGLPGLADEMSTDPFRNNDLVRRIEYIMEERQTETLRSDSLPAIRHIANKLQTAKTKAGRFEAAVETCIEMGFDYAAYYHITQRTPLKLDLHVQNGPRAIQAVAYPSAGPNDLVGWVTLNGQSRLAAPNDTPNHPLVARGRLGAVACVPVQFDSEHFGVLAAFRDRPNSISQENVMMLELLGAQLGMALSRDD